ncbi:transcriptional regulator with XRE-family HTH domain [Hoyosella altamirensis]|uniref:Transcriptional regulator with XRE-family HTH domain n=1 Tax=Hoyosella altamirensis TaxID=616997 RepID=A0A839RNJ9_9ACTN|nr:helix-turn-helix transcriptional regulator [Hoyosella altamirensis]MBB3037511.1 transcriptional regulator with XRE-family HTH domain [Hoyosella altamirensis]
MAQADGEFDGAKDNSELIAEESGIDADDAAGGVDEQDSPERSAETDNEVGDASDLEKDSDASRQAGGPAAVRVVSNAAQDIGSFIRAQRELAQVSLRQLAERAGVSNPYLSQIERGLRKPSAEVLGQIAKGLRVSAEALYVRAGILEQRQSSPVRDAVLADATLNERQKQVILEIYNSFCHENEASQE